MPGVNPAVLPRTGQTVMLVDRAKMKHGPLVKRLRLPDGGPPLPEPPPEVDWNAYNQVSYPILGNDEYGDCFYAAACHQAQTWTGTMGNECEFDANDVIRSYLELAGGDNGLTNDQIRGEWMKGLCGGDRRILGWAGIDPRDDYTMRLALYLFGGLTFTLGIPNRWLRDVQPGAVWDAQRGDRPNPSNGHAVHLTAAREEGYAVQTWGFNPPVTLTAAGVNVCDPEAIVTMSSDWIDPQSGKSPSGYTYDELARYWEILGGEPLPPNPSPTPPTPTPTPPCPPTPPGPPTPPEPCPGAMALTHAGEIHVHFHPHLPWEGQAAPPSVSFPPWIDVILTLLCEGRQALRARNGQASEKGAGK